MSHGKHPDALMGWSSLRFTLLAPLAAIAVFLGCHLVYAQEASAIYRLDWESVSWSGDSQDQAPTSAPPPWTASHKIKYGMKQAFFRPGAYIFPGLATTFIQLREHEQPHKETGDKVADTLSRYAIQFGTRSTKTLLASGLYPSLFGQDPRYQPFPQRGFGARVWYATSRVFVAKGRNGQSQFNISRIGGSLTASALANLWERNTPGRDRIGVGPTFRRFGIMVGFDVLSFVVIKEFGPDIKKFVFRK